MELYFVTSRCANNVEPHFNALEILLFPSFCAIPILQLSFILHAILLPAATPRLVNTVSSSLVKHYSFPV